MPMTDGITVDLLTGIIISPSLAGGKPLTSFLFSRISHREERVRRLMGFAAHPDDLLWPSAPESLREDTKKAYAWRVQLAEKIQYHAAYAVRRRGLAAWQNQPPSFVPTGLSLLWRYWLARSLVAANLDQAATVQEAERREMTLCLVE